MATTQKRTRPLKLDETKARQEREFIEATASDITGDDKTRARARLILALMNGADMRAETADAGISLATAREKIKQFNEGGWKALLTVMTPRGGDFLARYEQGFWAERLTRVLLDRSSVYRAIPYGTSRSEPFTDMQSFRQYRETEFLLQAWSAGGRWKRPDLITIPRDLLREEKGNDAWTPDLQHLDNAHCHPYVASAGAAIEVETSLWQVARATVSPSFTVKDEDLSALRNWVHANGIPLFIVQVFYNCAKVTIYGRLAGSSIEPTNGEIVERLAEGTLLRGSGGPGQADEHAQARGK